MSEDSLEREYYAILAIVDEFDKRLLTIKGWGVTLSLAALAWGFQYQHYGIFLVAALSGIAFWIIEGVIKRHQMRYYLRMREIEVLEFERAQGLGHAERSSPRIDWSWSEAARVYAGKKPRPGPTSVTGPRDSYSDTWFFPHVMFPHAISVLAGLALFYAARARMYSFDQAWQW